MADRRTNKRRRTETSTPYDMDNPNNWTVDILRKKLEEMGIWTPSSMSKANLKVLFIENSKQRRTPAQTNTLNVVANTANETNQRRTSRLNRTIASTNANNIDHDVRPETMLRPNVDLTRAEIDDQSPEQQSARADNMAAPMQNHSGVIQQLQTTINLLLTREMQRETVAHDVSDNNNKLDAAMARLSGTQDASGSQRDLHHSSDSDGTVQETRPWCGQGTTHSPTHGGSVLELDNVARTLWDSSVAQSTKAAYETGFRTYVSFLLLQGFVALVLPHQAPPVTEELLVLFVAYCYKNLKLSHATIKLYICGIKHMCLQFTEGPQWLYSSHLSPRLTAVLNGVKRVQGCTTKTRLPITADILGQLCAKWRAGFFDAYTDLLLETVCTIAFFGFLRCGEFTCTRKFDAKLNLCLGDIDVQEEYINLHLKSSKTDPFRKGVNVCLFKTKKKVCPHDSMTKYLNVRCKTENNSDLPLFVTSLGVALTRSVFIGYVKESLSAIGFDSELYNGHSFRIGAATSAASNHVQDHLIKTLGRWSSDTYCRYIRTPRETLGKAQSAMAKTMLD